MKRTIAIILLATTTGCVNPQIGGIDTYVATTPNTFSEARVFYLNDPEPPLDQYYPDLRRLLSAFEVNRAEREKAKGESDKTPAAQREELGKAPETKQQLRENQIEWAARRVRHNDPLSIIINKVVTPSGPSRHVAVVLDILTKGDQRVKPLVVWYQRNVFGGKELGFENLLVYFDAAWDSKMPAHFRLRLIDVATEQNQAMRAMLDQVEKLAAGFGGIVPHTIVPGVEIGIEAARQLLTNRHNTLLMDYTVEFFAAADSKESGGADLGYLSTGQWIAIGSNRNLDVERWRDPFYFDQRTLRVYGQEDVQMLREVESTPRAPNGPTITKAPIARTALLAQLRDRPRVDAPILVLTISTAESVVPTIVQDRSEELIKLLTDSPAKMNFDALESNILSLSSGVKTFVAKRRVEREQNKDAMTSLINLLTKHNEAVAKDAKEDTKQHRLSNNDVSLIMLTLERQTGITQNNSVKQWLDWWDAEGKDGRFEFREQLQRKMWVFLSKNGAAANSNEQPQPAVAEGP